MNYRDAQQEYLRFGKALLSGDSNFPEIPPAVSTDVFDTFVEESIAAKIFRFITMGSDVVKFYAKAGALNVYAPNEASPTPETKLSFDPPIVLEAREVRAVSRISDVAEEESVVDLVAMTVEDMARSIADAVDKNVFRGRGDGSDAYNLFTGLQHAHTLAGSRTQTRDLEKAPLTVEHVNSAVAALEELGYRDDLVMIIHPKAALHLRNDLAEKGLETISADVLRTGEVNAIFGLKKVYVTTHLEKRNYSSSDNSKVSDVIVCSARDAGVGGYRRSLRIERDRDVEAGLTKVAASIRFAWRIARTDAVYIIRNVLAE
ncbi:MAG: phage major capsid protein [Candidatus Caldarchaeum sp.]|nr:phage major capsid protein [Candidatus Caldarchaeum sp.]MCX8200818.1 phage major capsid protein [Candidatus Caldarchaeum sp.]MDW8063583.1 phage major capsid protein [Candidatus Caldarchaeum sp.]MDW8434800.1 phage major capsid protein [Candidatus Caldarchaeum sp.]